MKIVMFNLNGRGGMLHYSSQFANDLLPKNSVWAVIPSYAETKFYDKKVKLIKLIAPPDIKKTITETLNFKQLFDVIKQIKKINPERVYIMDNHPWYFLFGWVFRKKLWVVQHDPILHSGEAQFPLSLVINNINIFLRKVAKKVIVHSEKFRKYLLSINTPEEKIIVQDHVSYDFFKKYGNKKLKTEKNTILFFGRIKHYKGIQTLIDSEKYFKKLKNYKIIIAGSGDFTDFAPQVKGNKHFEIHNKFIKEEEISDFFRRSAVVVVPYYNATQSGIIPVAYAFNKPVVATNVGGIPEMKKKGKKLVLIPPKNAKKLAEEVCKLL
jgi:alpha-maltose-1-phosphate synthase